MVRRSVREAGSIPASKISGTTARRSRSVGRAPASGSAKRSATRSSDVLQLADVPGPGVAAEPREDRAERAALRLGRAVPEEGALEQLLGDERDVLAPLPQRRDVDRQDVEPEVEILAELAAADALAELAVRRREDAHVDRRRDVAAEPQDLPLLEDAQQPALERERDVPDLV